MVHRRDVLSTVALGGLLASPGCLDADGAGDASTPTPTQTPTSVPTETQSPTPTRTEASPEDGFVSPTDSPDPIPALACEDESFERMGAWADDIVWGTVTDDGLSVFTLRASARSIALGETITITFRNVSEQTQLVGNRHKSNLSIRTEAGWSEVRGWADGQPKPITDEALEIEPGETIVWEFALTDEGVIGMSYPNHRDTLQVCPSLQSGRYRFAVGTLVDFSAGLAVSFDVTDSA